MDRDREKLEQQKESYDRATKPPKTLKDAKYGLYDKIGKKLSVKAVDVIIWAVVGLLAITLILGIAMGK